jgi:hypothetical protein
MGGAFGTVDDVILDSRGRAVRLMVEALKLSRRIKGARRAVIYVF